MQAKLPFQIQQTATSLFAGSTGFTHGQMYEFFSAELGMDPTVAGFFPGSNREQSFKNWLKVFSLPKQKELLLALCEVEMGSYHGWPSKEQRQDLRQMLEKWMPSTAPLDSAASVVLDQLTLAKVHETWEKAIARRETDPDGALTIARTLIEDVVKHLLEEIDGSYDEKADLPDLYKALTKRMKLAPSQHTEDAFKQVLRGCISIVNGLAAARNRLGDAHGSGRKSYKPSARHAELAVNVAQSLAVFIIRTWEERREQILADASGADRTVVEIKTAAPAERL